MEWLATAANRGSIPTGPYEIDNSCKFEDDNDEYLTRTNASGTNRKTWTVSWWFKQTELPTMLGSYTEHWQGGVYGEATRAGLDNADRLWIDVGGGDGNTGTRFRSLSSAKLRDVSAWYHVVIACDSTQSTEADRLKVWLNGEEITAWDQHQIPTLNFQSAIQGTSGVVMKWGSYDSTYHGFCGYLAECNYLDGVTATQNNFGEFDDDSGIWIPKQYTGSYGTNGCYLDFGDSSDMGANAKGNDTNFTLNNIAAINQATDTPTNNFCTINPLVDNNFAIFALSEGGTRGPNTGEGNKAVGTFGVSKGKWYWEGVTTSASGLNYWQWGITRVDMQQGNSHDPGQGSAWYSAENTFLTQTGVGSSDPTYNTGITSYTVGDIWSISLNCDVSPYEMTLRFNNSVPGTTSNNTDRSVGTFASEDAVMPYYFLYNVASDDTWHNFGNPFISTLSGGNTDANGYGDFKYAPPSGYYALCSKNLAEYG